MLLFESNSFDEIEINRTIKRTNKQH